MRVLLFPFLLGAGLLAPGWMLGRALGTSAGLLGAFLGSAALLLNLILLLDGLDIALSPPHLAGGLAIICLGLAAITKARGKSPATPRSLPLWSGFKWRPYHWFLVPGVIGLSAIILKASLDPLSGPDTVFRWNFIATQMVREGNLHFYPSVTATDFLHYGWCDGISPLISNLYFWSYLSLGETESWATVPVVVLQGVLLFQLVFELAKRPGGPAAGCVAIGLLATSSVLLSGIAIGQETGLTALSLVAMFLFIERYRESKSGTWLVWAGIAAGVGGLAREYGVVFCALGALNLTGQRLRPRHWLIFFLSSFAVMGPWYIRNWIRTGNPLYSHDLHGLFPANPVHAEYMQMISGFGDDPEALPTLAKLLAQLAAVPIVIGLIGMIRCLRESWPRAFATISVCGLWLWSVGQTSGGYAYSLRVLTPALALSSVYGGQFLARWADSKRSWLLALVLSAVAIDAAERALIMPYKFSVNWWRDGSTGWLRIREEINWWNHRPYWAELVAAAEGNQILVTDPFAHAFLVNLNAKPVSYFSPAVRYLFEPGADYQACCARLRAEGVRFILLPPADPSGITNTQLSAHRFFSKLRETKPARTTPAFVAYDLGR